MKSAEQWVDENDRGGAFVIYKKRDEAIEFIRAVQNDAVPMRESADIELNRATAILSAIDTQAESGADVRAKIDIAAGIQRSAELRIMAAQSESHPMQTVAANITKSSPPFLRGIIFTCEHHHEWESAVGAMFCQMPWCPCCERTGKGRRPATGWMGRWE